jgi:hypothetical protein
MKAVNWTKLSNNKIRNSVWAVDDVPEVLLDYSIIDFFFEDHSQKAAAASAAVAEQKKAQKKAVDRIKFLSAPPAGVEAALVVPIANHISMGVFFGRAAAQRSFFDGFGFGQ